MPITLTGRMSKGHWLKNFWSKLKRVRNKSRQHAFCQKRKLRQRKISSTCQNWLLSPFSFSEERYSALPWWSLNSQRSSMLQIKSDGHMVKNCAFNNTGRRESSNMAKLEGVALISSTKNQSNEWFIDLAATKHMTNSRSIFLKLCWMPKTEEHLS